MKKALLLISVFFTLVHFGRSANAQEKMINQKAVSIEQIYLFKG